MSFDIFLMRFSAGRARADRAGAMRILAPLVDGPIDDLDVVTIRTLDGDAAVYGLKEADSLMFNHVSGQHVWDVMVEVAKAGSYVIMPVGCPTCVVDAADAVELPEVLGDELGTGVLIVHSGAELLAAVESA